MIIVCSLSFQFSQQISNTFVNNGVDVTGQNEWVTEEGRLRMIGAANNSLGGLMNISSNV